VTGFIGDASVEQEIGALDMLRSHVVLLGTGASKAALPTGDRSGRQLPLMREIADETRNDRLTT
jgi:hypothetical protein